MSNINHTCWTLSLKLQVIVQKPVMLFSTFIVPGGWFPKTSKNIHIHICLYFTTLFKLHCSANFIVRLKWKQIYTFSGKQRIIILKHNSLLIVHGFLNAKCQLFWNNCLQTWFYHDGNSTFLGEILLINVKYKYK